MSESGETLGLPSALDVLGALGLLAASGLKALGLLEALGLPGVLGLVLATEVLGSLGTGGDFRLRPGGTSERYRVQAAEATTRDTRPGRRGVSRGPFG